MYPSILVIGDNIDNCINISNFLQDYAKYVDYETNINNDDNKNYDITIYTFTNDILYEIMDYSLNNFSIIFTCNTNESFLQKIMLLGVDIIAPFNLDNEKINHILLIYKLTQKYKKNLLC